MSTASDRLREIDRAAKEDGTVEWHGIKSADGLQVSFHVGAAILPQVADLMDAADELEQERLAPVQDYALRAAMWRKVIDALHDLERAIEEVAL